MIPTKERDVLLSLIDIFKMMSTHYVDSMDDAMTILKYLTQAMKNTEVYPSEVDKRIDVCVGESKSFCLMFRTTGDGLLIDRVIESNVIKFK